MKQNLMLHEKAEGPTGAIAFVGERLSPSSFLAWASRSEMLKALMDDATPLGPDNLT